MSLVATLAHALVAHTGIRGAEAMPIALAVCVAAERGIRASTPQEMFSALAAQMKPADEADAIVRVRDWLNEADLSEAQIPGLQRHFPINVSARIDWTAELEALVDDARYREPFIPISPRIGAALGAALDIPDGDTIACLHTGSATIAWGLAQGRPVTLHVTNWQTEIVMALFAFADGRPLRVDRRNPIETIPYSEGSFTFGEDHAPRTKAYDHLISVPPLGYRMKQGDAAGVLFEAWQAEQLAHRARKSFTSLVTDGLLFRESRNETAFRERLCTSGGLTITSLPPGIFGRASGVQVNLLGIDAIERPAAAFVDGRTMERVSRSGREQEDLIVQQLDQLAEAPSRRVDLQELAGNGFNLLPGRYLVSGALARMEAAMAARPAVRLGDIAQIIRPRAPQPLRGDPSESDATALEIAVGDIADGKVGYPSKEVRFPAGERGSLSRVQVAGHDILVSIKGNVGLVGIVDESADAADMFGTPHIISQSLAIIRLKLGGPIRSARILAGILASPQMRERLRALAVGTTVASLPSSALQDLTIPVPDADEAFEIEDGLDALDRLKKEIADRTFNHDVLRDALWRKFWNMPVEQADA
jgi:hypothetical protein